MANSTIRLVAIVVALFASSINGIANAETPGSNKTWSGCWGDPSPASTSGLHCVINGPASCAYSGSLATNDSRATCTYATTVGASATCRPDYFVQGGNTYVRALCEADNAQTLCYDPGPRQPGDIYYEPGTMICYPLATTSTLRASPETLDFGEQLLGTSSTARTFIIGNFGGQWIQITTTTTVTGAGYSVPNSTNTCMGALLNPGETCSISVIYQPTAVGPQTGYVTVWYAPQGQSQRSLIAGLNGAGATTGSGPRVGFDPVSTTFGSVVYGATSAQKAVSVMNVGFDPLTIDSIRTVGAEFTLVSHTCTAPLAPGSQCSAVVQFQPRVLGSRTGFLEVASDAPYSPHQSPLTGSGASPPSSYSQDDKNAGSSDGDDIAWGPGLLLAGKETGAPAGSTEEEAADHIGDRVTVNGSRCPPGWSCYIPGDGNGYFNLIGLLRRPDDVIGRPSGGCAPGEMAALEPEPSGPGPAPFALAAADPYAYASATADAYLGEIGRNVSTSLGMFALDPVHTGTGNKVHEQVDYAAFGAYPLHWIRTYNSLPMQSTAMVTQAFGPGWFSSWDRAVKLNGTTKVRVSRGDGKSYEFHWNSTYARWDPPLSVASALEQLKNPGGDTTGWRYTTKEGDVENFDASGRLTSISLVDGKVYSLAYDESARLSSVGNPFGRTMQFTYDANGRVATMIDPEGQETTYGYDDASRLVAVTYVDGRVRQYKYENPGSAFDLTSIVDEEGSTYVAFAYDTANRAVANSFVGGVGTATITYSGSASTAVTPEGTNWVRTFVQNRGKVQLASVVPSCSDCGNGGGTYSYDDSGLLTSVTDRRGVQTTFSYDARGLPSQRVENAGTASSRTTTFNWHPTLRRVSQVAGPLTTVSNVYDSAGRLTQRTVSGGGISQAATYQYNAAGLLKEIDGPRTDVVDKTTYEYDALGNLTTVTNAAGQVTAFTYDVHGRTIGATLSDGTTQSVSYDPRGRVLTQTSAGRTTLFTYNGVGQVDTITNADGLVTSFVYDSAHRLIGQDRPTEKIRFTLDGSGRTTRTDVYDQANLLSATYSTQYDGLGRVKKLTESTGQETQYSRSDSTPTVIVTRTDPAGAISRTHFDALGRATLFYGGPGANTTNVFNLNDQVTSITPPGINATTYAYNQVGGNTMMSSPDSGTTTRTFNSAGQVATETDARGASVTKTYDMLGRITSLAYSDGKVIGLTYDAGAYAKGKLTGLTDFSGSTTLAYDSQGLIVSKTQNVGGLVRTLQYVHDVNGKVTSIQYPSGRIVSIGYAEGRIVSLAVDGQSLVSGVQYFPFGDVESWLFGNGAESTRYLDLDKRIARYLTPTGARLLTYDLAGRVLGIDSVAGGVTSSQTFSYDALGQLASFTGFTSASPSETSSYVHSPNGNRTSRVVGGVTQTYIYESRKNRLSSIMQGGQPISSFTYDLAGNITGEGGRLYGYDARGKMTQVSASGLTTTYLYNGFGQRVKKSNAGGTSHFMYDTAGHLIGEYNANGDPVKEIFWLGDIPVGVVSGTAAASAFIWSDHLNTPRAITDTLGRVLWSWDSEPFGDTLPNENPTGLGTYTFNLRFPGQYYDAETGLHQNGARDYRPSIGRYMTADPLGLTPGTNPYLYASADPLRVIDPSGRNACDSPEFWDTVFNQFFAGNDALAHAVSNAVTSWLLTGFGVSVVANNLSGRAFLRYVLEEYVFSPAAFRSYGAYLAARAALGGVLVRAAAVAGVAEAGIFTGGLINALKDCIRDCATHKP